MKPRMATLMLLAGLLAISLVSGNCPADTQPGDLADACRKAKADFRPLTQTDVADARQRLTEAVDRLDQRLAQAGPNGQDWRKYTQWDKLRDELRPDHQPDNAALTRIYQRYAADFDGLELVWFLDVQQALRNYLATAGAVDNPKIRAGYEEMLDKLAKSVEAYVQRPTTDDALVISESIRWLDDARQAPALVEELRRHFVHPNLMAEISAAVVGAGIAEPVDDTTSIRDCILGTDIHGTAHTIGQTSVELPTEANFGVVDTIFFGTTTSESVGFHHPVTIFSDSVTNLAATKRLWIDASGLASHPAASSATTRIEINDIQSNKGRRLIERMAWKRAAKQQCAAEAIASRHAEAQLNDRIDQQAAEPLDRANQAYVDKFRRPFTERKLFPEELRFSTTPRAISIVGLQAGGGKVAAPAVPPPVIDGADMSVRVHESMVNNLAFDALAGRTVYEEKVQAAVTDALGHLPDKMKGDDDGKPWAITLARRQPISVTFADDGFKITIRGDRYYKGNEDYPAMNVTAVYKIEKSEKGYKAIRQGDVQVIPPDLGPGKQLDARRQVIRTLLEKRFAKVFEPEILGEGLELPGKWKAAGKLLPIEVVARDGWLVIAWKRAASSAEVAAAK